MTRAAGQFLQGALYTDDNVPTGRYDHYSQEYARFVYTAAHHIDRQDIRAAVAPGMKNAGAHTDALVEFVDIYPTLSELAGLPRPGHLEDMSLKPLLDDPKHSWKSAAFSQYPRNELMGYSMRTDRYRFTVWVDRNDHTKVDATELYDHQTDPQENTNIAKDPANADLVKKLMAQWDKGWQGAKPAVLAETRTGK